MEMIVQSIGFGLITASLLAIASVGFTMQFGVTNVLNLAYAAVMTASAYVGYALNQHGVSIWVCALAGSLFGAVASMALNRLLYHPFIRHGTRLFGMIIATIAVGLIVQYLVVVVWSPNFVSYHGIASEPVRAAGMVFTTTQLAILGVAVAAMLLIHALLAYTQLGRAMRATAANPALARSCGIPTERVVDGAWLISGALCGLAGVIFGMNTISFTPFTDQGFLVVILAAAILGGVGKPYGAMAGALVIGVATELAALVIDPAYKNVIAFAILGVVLLLRPQGLFGDPSGGREVAA